MQATVYNLAGAGGGYGRVERRDLRHRAQHSVVHQAVLRQQANARLGTHDTKTRAEVSGGGAQAVAPEGHRARPPG